MEAVVLYLERLGRGAGAAAGATRQAVLRTAMEAIAEYERGLSAGLLDAVESIDGAIVHGVTGRNQLAHRVPTVSFTVKGIESSAIAAALAEHGIGARSGHMYAPRLMQRLNLMPGGMVRVSLVHYNTAAEIARFRDVLTEVVTALRPTRQQDAAVPTAGR
jgi:selenocysteine lyase/cysteine desulfurase